MGLKTRIDEALDAEDWLVRTSFSRANLAELAQKPVVFTRFAGSQIVAGRRRPGVQVVMILGVAENPDIVDSDSIEETEERMVAVLRLVRDCYPELLPTVVNYNHKVFAERTARGSVGREYVTVTFPILGP